ncbi:hypothetical protein [Slackia exigua]|uniref:hypothetical protein n=1 Tax=Slackia exigua TaxID=84109 RepID=UPI0028D53110|nr:hypothetical protein [Slackia exigua]
MDCSNLNMTLIAVTAIAAVITSVASCCMALSAFRTLRASNKQAQFNARVNTWLVTKRLAEGFIRHGDELRDYLKAPADLTTAWKANDLQRFKSSILGLLESIESSDAETYSWVIQNHLKEISYSAQLLFGEGKTEVIPSFLDKYYFFCIDIMHCFNSRLNEEKEKEVDDGIESFLLWNGDKSETKDSSVLIQEIDCVMQMSRKICSDKFKDIVDREIRIEQHCRFRRVIKFV